MREYASADDALSHLHNNHFSCSQPAKTGKPFDDPCFVWVHRTQSASQEMQDDGQTLVVSSVEAFFEHLRAIHTKTQELHDLVTSVTEEKNHVDSRPHLLSSLVHAFEELMGIYLLKAKELSWINRIRLEPGVEKSRNPELLPRRLSTIINLGQTKLDRIHECLDIAKRDIILLGTTSRHMSKIVIAPIGPEFLVVSLVSNLQNNTLIQCTDKNINVISHYQRHASRLFSLRASRQLNRRAFVEIHALEEDVEALRAVINSQKRLLTSYQRLFSPQSLKSPTTEWTYYKDRKSLFKLEKKYIERQQRRLNDCDKVLAVLQKKTRVLRADMKQRIEILEEGHGKAIRVFTIVTLFFLPLYALCPLLLLL
jgi:Mg2+ and Co2+ transporter CorA